MPKTQPATAKLSDAQLVTLVTLSAAAQRPDGSLLPLPDKLEAKGAALNRVMIEILCKRKLAEEKQTKSDAPEWRRDKEGRPLGLFITKSGLLALGINEAKEAKPSQAAASLPRQRKTAAKPPSKARKASAAKPKERAALSQSKQETVIKMWMGGFAPLGYDARDRKLVINEVEAESVRYIFRRYLEFGSVYKLKADLVAKRITSKRRTRANGNPYGGCSMAAGALYQMLQNPIYLGRIGYRGEVYEGEHEPIIDAELWEAVQQSLAAKRRARRNGSNAKVPSLLVGLLFDSEGRQLTPSHAAKGGKRYRYYVSRSLITDPGRPSTSSWRLPAVELERVVLSQISQLLVDQSRLWGLFKKAKLSHQKAASALKRGNALAQDLLRRPGDAVRQLLLDLVKQVVVHEDRIKTELRVESLLKQLSGKGIKPDSVITLSTPCQFSRRGSEMRLVIGDRFGAEDRPDATLIAALVRAHAWWQELCGGKIQSIRELANRGGSDERYVARVLKLAFLAPDITVAILDGRQAPHLTADMLIKMPDFPSSWALQRPRLDFMVRAPAS